MSNSQKPDGGPAFPYLTASETGREVTTHEGEHGMTLRDYFAAKAMQAQWPLMVSEGVAHNLDPARSAVLCAECAFLMADAMLKARSA